MKAIGMKALRHTGIVVTDLQRSLEFYRDVLGLKPVIDFQLEGPFIDDLSAMNGVQLRMVKLVADDGGMVELLYYVSHPRTRTDDNELCEIGPTHVAFTVADVDRAYAQLSAAGVPFNHPPIVSPDGKAKVAFCRDPDGTFLELVEELSGG